MNKADISAVQASKDHLSSSPHKATHDLVDHKAFPDKRMASALVQESIYRGNGYKTHTSRHDVGNGAAFLHVSAWRPKGSAMKPPAKPSIPARTNPEMVKPLGVKGMKKSDLLNLLLKAQKEGRLKVRNLIAKVEQIPAEVIEKSIPFSVNTSIHTPDEVRVKFSGGMMADKHKAVVAEAEKQGKKVAVHHYETPFGRVVHGMEIHNGEPVKKAELSAQGRNQIKEENFALPDSRYPIHDIEHARNALARVAQNGSEKEQKQVKAAVHKKYPSLEKSQGDTKAELRAEKETEEDPMEPGMKAHIDSSPHKKTHEMVNHLYVTHDRHTSDSEHHDNISDVARFAHAAAHKGHNVHISLVDDASDQTVHLLSAWKPKK